jgi:signal transduction histidine kinase
MSDIGYVTPQERAIYRQYEDQRRIRLAGVIASASCLLSVLTSIALTIYLLFQLHSPNALIFAVTITAWLDIGCYGLGVIAARHARPNLAALCVCGGVMLTIVVMLVYSLATTGFTFFSLGLLLSLPLVVVFSGILGNTPFLITVITVSTVGGCGVLLFNAQAPVLEQNVFGATLLLATTLITPGVMLVIFQQGYQRTLRELGDVRIAYERASALDDLKNQFIVNVNHELRNPVMAMMGHLDILDMSLESAPRAPATGDAGRHARSGKPARAARQHSGRQPHGARLRRFYPGACSAGSGDSGGNSTDRSEGRQPARTGNPGPGARRAEHLG